MKTTAIHHSADFDGVFCREIARKFLPDAELIGWDYKDPTIPFPDSDRIFVLDLSPDCFSSMPDINEVCRRLIWIDHHKSAIEKWPSEIPGYRIDGVAACRLSWFYFTALERYKAQTLTADFTWFQGHYPWAQKQDFVDRKLQEPIAVRLAGEYDINDKRDPNAALFQHGLRSQCLDGAWPLLLSTEGEWPLKQVIHLLNAGVGVAYAKSKENDSIIKNLGFDLEWEGLKFLACNHAMFNSQLFLSGLRPDHDACFGFKWDGKKWNVSLYHAPGKEHHDLSKIASKYGGGGHAGACGFRCLDLPFGVESRVA